MTQNDRIVIDTIPSRFEMEFDGENFVFEIYRNDYNDRIYISVFDEDMVPIVLGEKLIYGEQVFGTINDPRLPLAYMVPYDESNQENEVTGATFNKAVFIFLPQDDADDADDVTDIFDDDLDADDAEDDYADQELTDDDPINLYGTDTTVDDGSDDS